MASIIPSQNLTETGLTRWLIVLSVMLVAVIEVLDVTIVNVALSHMLGALGTTRDQVTWVLTSYIVASAIVMPLTGFLVRRLGRKKLLLINIVGFLISSMLCGISQSLMQMVVFRVLQGLFGAALIPLSQYILLDTFNREESGKAMAIWGIGIMVGPLLGPTLGGYITDIWNWRWIFYINLPVCIIAFLLALQVIKESPVIKKPIDWLGMFWMATGVGFLQIFLDRGETEDWFHSKLIVFSFFAAIICLSVFMVRGLHKADNIINLRVFFDANFRRSCIIMILFAMGLFGLIAIQPLMMQELMHYPAKDAGLVMGPRGLSSAIAMVIVARLITKVDPRIFIVSGLLISAYTSYLMSLFNLTTSFEVMTFISFLQGFGIGLFFVPLSTITFSTLSAEHHAEASGLFNFARSLGTSIGITLVSTFIARSSQINWNNLIGNLTSYNANFQNWLQSHHLSLNDHATIAYLAVQLGEQASMIAFVNAYRVIYFCFLITIPLVFLLKKPTIVKLSFAE